MASKIIYTFDVADQRARFIWNGVSYRAYVIRRDDDGDLSVDAMALTRTGRDRKRGLNGIWLTLEHSLDKRSEGAALASYVREIAGQS